MNDWMAEYPAPPRRGYFKGAGGLASEYLFQDAAQPSGGKQGGEGQESAVMMLHGYGANMHDLMPLARALPALRRWDVYSLNAPIALMGGASMRMWFQLESWMMELIARPSPSDHTRFYEHEVTPDYQQSYKLVHGIAAELAGRYEHLVIMGFSQGGMLAADVGVSLSVPGGRPGGVSLLKGVALLSTACFQKPLYNNLAKMAQMGAAEIARQVAVFQSHGKGDEVVHESHGYYLHQQLTRAFAKASYHVSTDGHTISPVHAAALNQWFDTLVS